MSSQPHAIDRVLSLALEPWALTHQMVGIVAAILARRLAHTDGADMGALISRSAPPAAAAASGGLAIIPVHGVIAPRANQLSDVSGATTFETAGRAVDAAVANPAVTTILLDVDSPGGSVLGATEFAQRLRQARSVKKVIAAANFQMCSAAYWVASNATEVVAAPSSVLGSVGIYTIHEDLSAALEKAGVKLTYISAGKFKVDGNETEPLSDSARARLTKQIDTYYARFVGDVAAGRHVSAATVRERFGQGATVTAEEALAAGMIDRVATFDELLDQVVPSRVTPASSALAALADARAQMNRTALDAARRRMQIH